MLQGVAPSTSPRSRWEDGCVAQGAQALGRVEDPAQELGLEENQDARTAGANRVWREGRPKQDGSGGFW